MIFELSNSYKCLCDLKTHELFLNQGMPWSTVAASTAAPAGGARASPRAPTLVHSTHVVVERPASPECRPSTLPCLNDASHDPIIGIANVNRSDFLTIFIDNVAVNRPQHPRPRTGRAGTADAMPPGPDRRTRAARARRRLLDVSNSRWSETPKPKPGSKNPVPTPSRR